ncbi:MULTISPECIES: triose-phosphate isomerase [Leuconostoc]|uniref:Triosephosphate isomerase n=2 Tax=Leuconostoc kimchii TaxID=136609 RepID=D5T3P7_LEUKI|nr:MULTISPECIES: triose-phosphate isomerase [Leuconostoc]ADG40896.1 triosephosphate isomerase [Leuconostoc kimchii IMSNU 11154]AEJ31130.1 triosephosphate isomerase [Leuconostoc sp. C2]QBR48219.1 triose-phosphate isomerase [Leuconostoc kimchii]
MSKMHKEQRVPFVVANWKINKLQADVVDFLKKVDGKVPDQAVVETGIAAQDLFLADLVRATAASPIHVVAENVHWEDSGAYTGETSPKALRDIGAKYVLIGHFERRKFFNETDSTVNLKVTAALRNGLRPIIDVDEDMSTYAQFMDAEPSVAQVAAALAGVSVDQIRNVTIAYEPTWAIGSGEAASADQAQKAAHLIRQTLAKLYSPVIAEQVRILYGGSVTPDNAREIMAQSDIDGVLVGTAALDPDKFLKLVAIAHDPNVPEFDVDHV